MINRTNDFYFKYLFGSVQNKEIALNFINSALLGTGKEFVDIFYTDKDSDPKYEGEKQCRLDIKAKLLPDDIIVDIEMQAVIDEHMAERSLFYWSRMYGSQLAKNDEYGELKQAIAINMLNFDYLKEPDWKNRYVVANTESKQALTDHLQIMFLELPKLLQQLQQQNKDVTEMTPLEQWGAYFCRAVSDEEMEMIPIMATALQAEKHFTEEEELRIAYERREDFLRDQRSREKSAQRVQKALEEANKKLVQAEQQAEQLNALYAKLAALGRLDDIQRVATDTNYRQQLLVDLTAK